MNTTELLRKTASVLRVQEEEKISLANKAESFEKEASINRSVINMIKEGLLDIDDIDEKIAEFQSNPKLLEDTVNFFEKSANVGELKDYALSTDINADQNFLLALS